MEAELRPPSPRQGDDGVGEGVVERRMKERRRRSVDGAEEKRRWRSRDGRGGHQAWGWLSG